VKKTKTGILLLNCSPVIILNFLPKSVVPRKAMITNETPIIKIRVKKSNMRETLLFTFI
jgi:hypothetical protein